MGVDIHGPSVYSDSSWRCATPLQAKTVFALQGSNHGRGVLFLSADLPLVLEHLSGQLRNPFNSALAWRVCSRRQTTRHPRRHPPPFHPTNTRHGLHRLPKRSQENHSSLVPRPLLSRSGRGPRRLLPGLPLRLDLHQVDQRTPGALRATLLGLVPTQLEHILQSPRTGISAHYLTPRSPPDGFTPSPSKTF